LAMLRLVFQSYKNATIQECRNTGISEYRNTKTESVELNQVRENLHPNLDEGLADSVDSPDTDFSELQEYRITGISEYRNI
jgi:hypothetical protein